MTQISQANPADGGTTGRVNLIVAPRFWLSVFACVAAAIPYLAFHLSGISLLETFWEFSCYRYFEAINYFEQATLPFWVVQGIPMALLQTVLLKVMLYFDMAAIGTADQIERFAQASTLLAYILIASSLLMSANLKRMRSLDAALLIAAVFALFPMTRFYFYFFAPDYWIFEVPLAIVSTAWAIIVLRNVDSEAQQPTLWHVALAGMWMALCFTQKPSLIGLGVLPILLSVLLPRGHLIQKLLRFALLLPAFLITHRIIMFAANKFDWPLTVVANRNYWGFFGNGATSLDGAMNLLPLLKALGFLIAPIILGCITLLVCTAVAFRIGDRRRVLIAVSILFGLTAGHTMVVLGRTSGTSIVDFAIYGIMLVPISVVLLPPLPRHHLIGVAALVSALLVALPNIWPTATQTNKLTSRIAEASNYVKSVGRPVTVVVHDNRAHPLTIEALALYTGQLQPLARGTGLRDRFLHGAEIAQTDAELRTAIVAGRLIVWGGAPNAPLVDERFPSIATAQEIHQIEMIPSWNVAHFAYAK